MVKLPFMMNTIATNNNIESSLTTIQLIHNQENKIYFKVKEKGESNILLTIDDQKIATIPLIIE